jgi:hypothetical protein
VLNCGEKACAVKGDAAICAMEHERLLDIDNNQKVEVVIGLLQSHRQQIMAWHSHAYVAATASFGALLVIGKYWIESPCKTLLALLCVVSVTVFLAIGTWLYLGVARDNYNGNEREKIKCEYALGLKEQGLYLKGEDFYFMPGAKDPGMPSKDIPALRRIHAVLSLLLVAFFLLTFFWSR